MFRSWFYSYLKVIECHYTDRLLSFIIGISDNGWDQFGHMEQKLGCGLREK